jgi:betaine-aldehyde dehydrogenase
LAEICSQFLPAGVLNMLTGTGQECGAPLLNHPQVSKLSFTGSTAVGKLVMEAAAKRILPVSLELGGKSPSIVFPDAAEDSSPPCGSRDRANPARPARGLFLHRKVYDSVLERLVDATSKLRVGDPLSEETDIGAIINERQFGKICGYIEEGLKQSGSKRLCGGLPSDDTSLGAGYFLRPTIFAQGSNEWRMAREEIFGPVLVAIPWETEDEVIRMANDTHYGLAAYIWTHDIGKARRAARDIEAGWVQINQGAGQLPGHSYGGYKQSGLGREFSLAGMLDSYTQTKNIYGQSSTIDWDELTIADSMSLKSASVDLPPGDDMFPNGRARMRSTTIASPATQPALSKAQWEAQVNLMRTAYNRPQGRRRNRRLPGQHQGREIGRTRPMPSDHLNHPGVC